MYPSKQSYTKPRLMETPEPQLNSDDDIFDFSFMGDVSITSDNAAITLLAILNKAHFALIAKGHERANRMNENLEETDNFHLEYFKVTFDKIIPPNKDNSPRKLQMNTLELHKLINLLISYGYVNSLDWLLNNVERKSFDLKQAVREGKPQETKNTYFHQAVSHSDKTALGLASVLYDFLFREGFENPFELDALNEHGESCLHICILQKVVREKTAKFLISKGADINLTLKREHFIHFPKLEHYSDKQYTALHCAARNGLYESVDFLLRHGADPHLLTQKGFSALDFTIPEVINNYRFYDLENNEKDEHSKIRALLKQYGAREIQAELSLDAMPKHIVSDLQAERELKKVSLSPEQSMQLDQFADAVNKIFAQDKIKKVVISGDSNAEVNQQIEELKNQYQGCYYFIEKLASDEGEQASKKRLKFCFTAYPLLTENEKTVIDVIGIQARQVILKNRLGYELLQRRVKPKNLDAYLKQYPKILQKIGKHTFELIDLRQADDYQFIVNTILTRPDRLQELIEGDPKFFEHVPFISASIVDKNTRGFAGGHQQNELFPLYMALSAPVEALNYIGPRDIGSPYRCTAMRKLLYMRTVIPRRIIMDYRQATYQLQCVAQDPSRYIPDHTLAVKESLESDAVFRRSQYKYPGSLPLYTTDGIMRESCFDPATKDTYSEVIVSGNTLINGPSKLKGRLLLVEQYFLERFLTRDYTEDTKNEMFFDREKSLGLLAKLTGVSGRLKLALIQTDMQGFKRKLPVLEQITKLEERKLIVRMRYIRCTILLGRLSQSPVGFSIQINSLQVELDHIQQEIAQINIENTYLAALATDPPLVTAQNNRKNNAEREKAGNTLVQFNMQLGTRHNKQQLANTSTTNYDSNVKAKVKHPA